MNDATSEMLNTTFSQMKQIITALHSRIEKLEQDIRIHQDLYQLVENMETKIANTLANSPQILENLNNRINKLEDRFDQLNMTDKIAIQEIVISCMQESSVIDDKVEAALDEKLENAVEECVDNIDWEDKVDSSVIRRIIRNDITFTVEVD